MWTHTAGLVHDQGSPLLGQTHKLVGMVVEPRVDPVLEVGWRGDLDLFLLLREHLNVSRGLAVRRPAHGVDGVVVVMS